MWGRALGAADLSGFWKITSDGIVWFKKSDALVGVRYYRAFDAQRNEKIILGEPGGYLNVSNLMATLDKNVLTEAARQELEATTVESRGSYPSAEARAKEIVRAGEVALQAGAAGAVAPKFQASTGDELIAAYEARAAEQAKVTDPAKKKKKKKKKPPQTPHWGWVVGGAIVAIGLIQFIRRSRA